MLHLAHTMSVLPPISPHRRELLTVRAPTVLHSGLTSTPSLVTIGVHWKSGEWVQDGGLAGNRFREHRGTFEKKRKRKGKLAAGAVTQAPGPFYGEG